MMEALHRYEASVNQVMGDGIMALFGAPDSAARQRLNEELARMTFGD
jgi:class 3 adenylate cyclase